MRLGFVITVSALALIAGCSSSTTTLPPSDSDGGEGGEGGSGGDPGGFGGSTAGDGGAGGSPAAGSGGSAGDMMDMEIDAGVDAEAPFVCPDTEVCSACTAGSACQPEDADDAGTATECMNLICETCAVGSYCAGGGADLVDCDAGFWDDDGDASTACVEWAACAPGEYISVAGTITEEPVCLSCESGSFSAVADQAECTTWQVCEAGDYVSQAPDALQDRLCTACDSGTQTTDINQTTCLSPSDCPAGTTQITAATLSAEAVCESCTAGEFCAGGTALPVDCETEFYDDDQQPDTACVAKSVCSALQFETGAGDLINDRTCDTLTVCPAGQFVSTASTATSNRSCSTCNSGDFSTSSNASSCATKTPCSALQFETANGGFTADRTCGTLAVCTAGQFVSTASTATSNRSCSTCDPGDFSTGTNASSCSTKTPCSALQFETADGGFTADRSCSLRTVCSALQFESNAGDATTDRTCDTLTICAPGEFVLAASTATTDRSCDSCVSGSFSTVSNAVGCTILDTCVAGEFVANAGDIASLVVDRNCQACTAGTNFTAGNNEASCATVTPCATNFTAATLDATQDDQNCLPHSCQALLAATPATGDGIQSIYTGAGPLSVLCDMTTDGGGWTQAVVIAGDTNAHVDNSGGYGDPTQQVTDAKLTDAIINEISSASGSDGFWLFQCEERLVGITNDNKVWTSAGTNTEVWRMDMDDFPAGGVELDTEYECVASRDEYVFDALGGNNSVDCIAPAVAYGKLSEIGCFDRLNLGVTPTWGNPGALWIR